MNYKAAFTFARREFREIAINVRERLIHARAMNDEADASYWFGCFIGEIDALFSCGCLTRDGRDKLCEWIKQYV